MKAFVTGLLIIRSIHFGNDKFKPIPSVTKFKIKKVRKLNIKYGVQTVFQSKIFRMHAGWNNVWRNNGTFCYKQNQ